MQGEQDASVRTLALVCCVDFGRNSYGNNISKRENRSGDIVLLTNEIIARLQKRIEKLPGVTTRPMFGYQCHSVNGKFFVGFKIKDRTKKIIIRLSTDLQKKALQTVELKINPFSQGAKMGWVELDATEADSSEIFFDWIRKGYNYAKKLSQQ